MRWAVSATFAVGLAGCTGRLGDRSDGVPEAYHAELRTTSYGVRHVSAADEGSLGYAIGVAAARDNACILVDQVLRVRGTRAALYGRGADDEHVRSDILHRALRLLELADEALPKLDPGVRARIEGYAAGFNRGIAEGGGTDDPICASEPWRQTPIAARDLEAYYLSLALITSGGALGDYIVGAAPPGVEAMQLHVSTPPPRGSGPGSNGWAIGGDLSGTGSGMLLANPHFPWNGELRFYELHLTIPGTLDVYGASLLGVPFVVVGFNENVAWTHTVTPSAHATVYELELAPGDDLAYIFDGETRPIEETQIAVAVLEDDGSTATVESSIYRSHFGLMLEGPGIEWDNGNAYTLRDANENVWRLPELWYRLAGAADVAGVVDLHEDTHASPWVYTIVADRAGDAAILEASRVPAFTPEVEALVAEQILEPGLPLLVYDFGFALLDGSTSETAWVGTAEGLVPVREAPQAVRRDYVANGNGAPWLVNLDEDMPPYSLMYYSYRSPISPRTRTSFARLESLEAPISLDELAAFVLDNRGSATDLLPEVLERCEANPSVDLGTEIVDLSEACAILAAWDGSDDLASPAGPLWREFLTQNIDDLFDAGGLFEVAFDPDDPLETPNTLVSAEAGEPDPILMRLAVAQQFLEALGFPLGTTLGEMQFVLRDGELATIPGSIGATGALNAFFVTTTTTSAVVDDEVPLALNEYSSLTEQGYVFTSGTSFLMAVDLAPSPPEARALLAYSQSTVVGSAHYDDQHGLYGDAETRAVLFDDAAIAADPELVIETISDVGP